MYWRNNKKKMYGGQYLISVFMKFDNLTGVFSLNNKLLIKLNNNHSRLTMIKRITVINYNIVHFLSLFINIVITLFNIYKKDHLSLLILKYNLKKSWSEIKERGEFGGVLFGKFFVIMECCRKLLDEEIGPGYRQEQLQKLDGVP